MKQPKRCNCDDIPKNTIHKIAAIILKDEKILVVKRKGLDEYISVGGKHEQSESHEESLIRECLEETSSRVSQPTFLGRFTDIAVVENIPMIIDTYIVQTTDNPVPSNEIEDCLWIDKDYSVKIASGLEKYIIPELIRRGLM